MTQKTLEDLLKERRGKLFLITRRQIMQFFVKDTDTSFHLTKINLPDNFILHDVIYDWQRSSFAFLIFSEDFPPVEEGLSFPFETTMQFLVKKWKCNALTKGDTK
jgi:hypothetical protein